MNNDEIKIDDEVYIKCEYIPGTKIKTTEVFPALTGIITKIFQNNTVNLFSEIDKHSWGFGFSDISLIYKRLGKLYYDSGEFRPAKKGEYFIDKNDTAYGPLNVFKRLSPNLTNYKDTILKPISNLIMEKEQMQQQYKILKPITLDTIINAGDISCSTFCEEVAKLFKILLNNNITFTTELQIEFLKPHFKDHPKWCDWLITNNFIEDIPQGIFYHTGQEFQDEDATWQIVTFGNLSAALVGSNGEYKGQVWDGKIHQILNRLKITKDEFKDITDNEPGRFHPIPGT